MLDATSVGSANICFSQAIYRSSLSVARHGRHSRKHAVGNNLALGQ